MQCLEENTLFDYVHGRLVAAARRQIAEHADQCASCRHLIAAALDETNPSDGKEAARAPSERGRTGQVLGGKYELGNVLGTGGMGVVYEATNSWTGRRVAIKLLHPFFSRDSEMARRFMQEARSSTRIANPAIVDVLDMGQDPADGALYMVQEFLVGETLRQRLIAKQRFAPAEALELMAPILSALASAHDAGVVHRDVKPDNIFLCADEQGRPTPKLIDFGISKIVTSELTATLHTGHPVGTPFYMSPEQLRADETIDGRADIWSVGVVLFELLSGRRPFQAPSFSDVIAQILTARAPSLRTVAPDLPPHIVDAVDRALSPAREQRFSDMRQLLDALLQPHKPARRRGVMVAALVGAALALAAAGVAALRTPAHAPMLATPAPVVVAPTAPPIAPAPIVAAAMSAPAPPPTPAPVHKHPHDSKTKTKLGARTSPEPAPPPAPPKELTAGPGPILDP